jgi:hypothetical protein
MATRKLTLLALVSILTMGCPTRPDLRVLRGSMASAPVMARIVVTRDPAGHPVRFRFLPAKAGL